MSARVREVSWSSISAVLLFFGCRRGNTSLCCPVRSVRCKYIRRSTLDARSPKMIDSVQSVCPLTLRRARAQCGGIPPFLL
eukprot:scaffold8245_cov97-Isochrysis_galbana.AAC.7